MRQNEPSTDTLVGSPFLVLELVYDRRPGHPQIGYVASICGRESTMVRRWKIPQHIPTESQMRDMAHHVTKLVVDATVTYLGTQREMPLT